MKVIYEDVLPDPDSCFRTLHINVPVKDLRWEYHYHPEMELVCVISGIGTRQVGYHKSNFTNGDLVLIGSNVPHSGFGLNSVDPHEEIVLQFPEEIINLPVQIAEMQPLRQMMKLAQLGLMFSTKIKEKILPKLYHLMNAESRNRYLLLLSILYELAESKDYELLNKEVMPHTILSKNRKRLQTIFSFVEKKYAEEIDIKEVAGLVNLTLPAFCNFFKKTTKITFTDYINQYRIDKACKLILQGKSISEACYNTGYNNISYFNRTFKKYMGKTPTEFNTEMLK